MYYKTEINDEVKYYDLNHNEIYPYWLDLSKHQINRNKKVLAQLKTNWRSVFKTIHNVYIDDTMHDVLMNKMYSLYFIHAKDNEEYYNKEKMLKRKNNGYIIKKINKYKNNKTKI